eukprot:3597571-Rhodomonas_salina.2
MALSYGATYGPVGSPSLCEVLLSTKSAVLYCLQIVLPPLGPAMQYHGRAVTSCLYGTRVPSTNSIRPEA